MKMHGRGWWMVAVAVALLTGACSKHELGARFERIGKVAGPKTLGQVEEIMGGSGRNAEDLVAPHAKGTSPKLQERLREILQGKPGVTVMVWTERIGSDVWIVLVDFDKGKTTGGGGTWRASPEELPIDNPRD
jgi:hypothetical protein